MHSVSCLPACDRALFLTLHAGSLKFLQKHDRKRCEIVGKLLRPLSSGTVEGINIPMLLGGAGADSMGAVGAVARPLRSMYSPSLM